MSDSVKKKIHDHLLVLFENVKYTEKSQDSIQLHLTLENCKDALSVASYLLETEKDPNEVRRLRKKMEELLMHMVAIKHNERVMNMNTITQRLKEEQQPVEMSTMRMRAVIEEAKQCDWALDLAELN